MRNARPKDLAGLAGVAAVVGNSHKALTPEILGLVRDRVGVAPLASRELVSVQSLLYGRPVPIWADDRFAHSFLEEAQLAPGRKLAQPENSGRVREPLLRFA
jgi:threonylcarbamoyladenosine tRNA methylthiotransferase MtaB